MTKSVAEDDATGPALAIFALGQVDASLSFLALLSEDARGPITTSLAYRLLSKLWSQYRIDCGIDQGRTLFSLDNGFELRLFAALVDELAEWPPLRSATAMVRAHAPALSGPARAIYEQEFEAKLILLSEVRDQLQRLPADLDPISRSARLIDRCQKLDAADDRGICWALNLASAFHSHVLGGAKAVPPLPALFRREMLRFDRSASWRAGALRSALAASAHMVAEAIFARAHGQFAFERHFAELRRHSRLGLAYSYFAGIGEVTPSLLGRLIGCSEPGARKMLRQFVAAGFARHKAPSPAYEFVEGFRLGWPGATWLRSFSMDDGRVSLGRFDE